VRRNGAKLGEGIPKLIRDFYANPNSGFLHLGLLRSGKVRGAVLKQCTTRYVKICKKFKKFKNLKKNGECKT
jgi:hypothetical protein